MILINTIVIVSLFENTISSLYYLFEGMLGALFSAPVFMFCMGIGIIYSRHSDSNTMIKRGIKLFLLGLIVNIFSIILPHYLLQYFLNSGNLIPIFGGLLLLFYVDILDFAGLSFWLSNRIPDNLKNTFTLLSKNVTAIYVAHWILIPITVILIKYANKSIVFNDLYITLIVLFIVIASTLCALAFKKVKNTV